MRFIYEKKGILLTCDKKLSDEEASWFINGALSRNQRSFDWMDVQLGPTHAALRYAKFGPSSEIIARM